MNMKKFYLKDKEEIFSHIRNNFIGLNKLNGSRNGIIYLSKESASKLFPNEDIEQEILDYFKEIEEKIYKEIYHKDCKISDAVKTFEELVCLGEFYVVVLSKNPQLPQIKRPKLPRILVGELIDKYPNVWKMNKKIFPKKFLIDFVQLNEEQTGQFYNDFMGIVFKNLIENNEDLLAKIPQLEQEEQIKAKKHINRLVDICFNKAVEWLINKPLYKTPALIEFFKKNKSIVELNLFIHNNYRKKTEDLDDYKIKQKNNLGNCFFGKFIYDTF